MSNEKKDVYAEIRKIDNKIYNIKLTYLELEQLESWLANINVVEEVEGSILERVIIACDEAKQTGDSV